MTWTPLPRGRRRAAPAPAAHGMPLSCSSACAHSNRASVPAHMAGDKMIQASSCCMSSVATACPTTGRPASPGRVCVCGGGGELGMPATVVRITRCKLCYICMTCSGLCKRTWMTLARKCLSSVRLIQSSRRACSSSAKVMRPGRGLLVRALLNNASNKSSRCLHCQSCVARARAHDAR